MIKLILIDLRNVLFNFDPHERVQAFIRLRPSSSLEEFGAISRAVLGEDAQALQQDFDCGKITAVEFKKSMERLLRTPELPEANFWSAHRAGFTPNQVAIQKCIKIKEVHPLIKLVALGQMDRKVFGHLLELCGVDFDDCIVSFMEGGEIKAESLNFLLVSFGVNEREYLRIDVPEKTRLFSALLESKT